MKQKIINMIVYVYLGPAENGQKANESLSSVFSGENLSGLNWSWSSPHTVGLWWRLLILIMTLALAGISRSSTLMGAWISLMIPGTGEWRRIPSLMHCVRYSSLPRSFLGLIVNIGLIYSEHWQLTERLRAKIAWMFTIKIKNRLNIYSCKSTECLQVKLCWLA